MGIHGLMKLLSDECPDAIREMDLANFMGRVVAVDASMAIYQFLVAVRSSGPEGTSHMLMNAAGEVTRFFFLFVCLCIDTFLFTPMCLHLVQCIYL